MYSVLLVISHTLFPPSHSWPEQECADKALIPAINDFLEQDGCIFNQAFVTTSTKLLSS